VRASSSTLMVHTPEKHDFSRMNLHDVTLWFRALTKSPLGHGSAVIAHHGQQGSLTP